MAVIEIIFASNNRHKLEEVEKILGAGFRLKTPSECGITEDIPEEQPTLEGNALQKARYIHERTGMNCFADDTGLEVEALNDEPGVYSARYAGEAKDSNDNMSLLLERLEGKDNRKARFRTAIALISEGKEHIFEGVVNGEITTERSGSDGFGYDPIFRPEGYAITFAEMDMSTKNEISHRGQATKKLVEFLKNATI